MNYFFLILLLLASCAPKILDSGLELFSSKAPVAVHHNRLRLFPNGIYSHRITIIDPKEKIREFHGFIKLSEQEIHVVGLSKLGTTFFKLTENLTTKNIAYRFYYPVPGKFKKNFVSFYSFMKAIFLLPLSGKTDQKNILVQSNSAGLPARYVDSRQEIEVTLAGYDKNRIPTTLAIKIRNFSIMIQIDDYQVGDDLAGPLRLGQ